MCPSRWFTGTRGILCPTANCFAKLIPVHNAGSRPGPEVTAIAFTTPLPLLVKEGTFAPLKVRGGWGVISLKTLFKSIGRFLICSLLARLGTTPPNGRRIFTWEEIWLDN